jgi:putative ABC transport system permease protein
VIVNEWMARHYWPGQDVIGKRISLGDPATDPEWVTIVGVTKDVAQGSLTQPMGEEMYLPALQQPNYLEQPKPQVGYMTLVVRADCRRACDAAALAPAIRGAIASIDPQVPLAAVQTMDTVLRNATARPRFYLVLLGIFAVVALVLAAVGIYGVTSYSVSRRTHEIGLRLALGAEPAQLLRQVVREGMVVAVAGAGAGFCGALLCTRLLRGILYGVPAHDPITFAGVTAILCGVALAASWIPARRATRITPLEALRGS